MGKSRKDAADTGAEALVEAVLAEGEGESKARLLLTRVSALERELHRERNKNDLIVDAIRQTVAALPPLAPLPDVPKAQEDDHVAMLDIGDVHVGDKVDPALTGGLSRYDFETFKARGLRLRKAFLRILDLHRRAYPVGELYINFLGDIVTGEAIFAGQAFQIDLPLLLQVFEGGYWFASLLRDLAGAFEAVHVRCVAGNHGRGYGRGQNHPRTNWDIALYWLLKILLSDQPNVDFEVSETSFLVYGIPGHERFRHALIHGDQARSWLGIPFYGMERTGARMTSMLGMTLDYVHAGHHHNEADWPSNRVEFLMNGSWVGGSDLSVNRLMRTSRPAQNMYFCHPRRGITARYSLQLDDWSEMLPDAKGVFRTEARPQAPQPEAIGKPKRRRR